MINKIKDFFSYSIIKRISVILFYLIFIGSLTLKCMYVQFTISINKVPVLTEINENMMITLFFTVLIICGIVIFLFGNKARDFIVVLDVILTLVLVADMLYGRYYYNPITVPILKQISFMNDVKDSTASLFRFRDIILFVDLIILIIMAIYLRKEKRRKPFYVQMLIGLLIIVTGVLGVKFKYSQLDTAKYAYERKYIGRDLGLIYYHYYDIKYSLDKVLAKKKKLTDEEIEIIESVNYTNSGSANEYTNIGKDKNLIIIQLEAFQDFLIDLEFEGKEVTPFLNELKKDSLYVPNYFIQTAGGNTVDAELLTNTSLQPTYGGSAYYEYPSNTYISLPKKLKEKGYSVNSYHGYEASFWNREVMHKTLGFDKYFSYNDFNMHEKVGWAISDRTFLKQSLDLSVEASKGNPFYSMMITLSSHHPYSAFYGGPYTTEDTCMFRRYMNAGQYVDSALKEFFDYLKEKGMYENSIIVMYGDHAGLFDKDAKQACESFGLEYTPYNWQKFEQIPLYIHIPGHTNNHQIDKACGQIDLLPTLANIMGFDMEYTMGHDILDDNYKGHIVRRNSNIITSDYIYIASEEKIYDFNTGEELELSNYEEEIKEFFNQLLAADLIYKSDYLKEYNEE